MTNTDTDMTPADIAAKLTPAQRQQFWDIQDKLRQSGGSISKCQEELRQQFRTTQERLRLGRVALDARDAEGEKK